VGVEEAPGCRTREIRCIFRELNFWL